MLQKLVFLFSTLYVLDFFKILIFSHILWVKCFLSILVIQLSVSSAKYKVVTITTSIIIIIYIYCALYWQSVFFVLTNTNSYMYLITV